ncbi:MAG: hypothetical protein RI920_188, partial [Pseudomonadota bacterium]
FSAAAIFSSIDAILPILGDCKNVHFSDETKVDFSSQRLKFVLEKSPKQQQRAHLE